ncbi:MAG TPA: ABC transporter ATP-binding protein/permease [Allosphingosinicella sp.]|nr:ABC transporter ATP-binding protein/permease [Allosphingosinicella sp.]
MTDSATGATPAGNGTGRDPGWQALRRFLPYLWPRHDWGLRARLIIALLLVLGAKAITLIMPFAYKGVIDRMGPGLEPGATLAIALVVAYAGARFGGVLFDNVRNGVFESVGQDAARRLSVDVFRHLHALSLRFHLERRTGALTRIVERGTKSIDSMLYFLVFNIGPTVIELIAVCTIFWIMFDAGLVGATLAMVMLYVLFTRKVTEWRLKVRKEWTEYDQRATQRAVDSLLNYETIKYFNAEEMERRRYDDAIERLTATNVRIETSLAALNIGQSLITNLMLAGAMGYTVWGWSRGLFTAGDVVLVNTLLVQLFRPLDMLGFVYREVRQGLVDMAAMFGLLDTPAEVRDAPDAVPLRVTDGALRFDNVRFGYEPDREILKGVDFTIAPGQTVAVVGPSGAGKSTLARLIYRFYDPQQGRILIDGQDVAQVTQASLRAAIGIVPQDAVLFNDTVGYNIGYGREGASQAEIQAAARGAAIGAFIESLPEGYDTRVGERGLKLSGGEKQRVAIARTLLKDPPVLILDEATSALDSRTEAAIQETLSDVAQRRTCLVIAHRLSTVVDADQIIVLDQGKVAERGTHAQLLRRNGLYAEMWTRQQSERETQGSEAEAAE